MEDNAARGVAFLALGLTVLFASLPLLGDDAIPGLIRVGLVIVIVGLFLEASRLFSLARDDERGK